MESIENLIDNNTRIELDEMAAHLGLNTTNRCSFPTRTRVAQAILVRIDEHFQPSSADREPCVRIAAWERGPGIRSIASGDLPSEELFSEIVAR